VSYADHDHDGDYATLHHRHYDDESAVRGLRQDLGAAEERVRALEDDLRSALASIRVLDRLRPTCVICQEAAADRQTSRGPACTDCVSDLPDGDTGADPDRPETWAFADAGERAFTHPDVLTVGITEGWAEPETDPARIDWDVRLAAAAIPFEVTGGRPVNPCEKTAIRYGRNELGLWGENLMADALVTVTCAHYRYLLMVERGDGRGWAVPGGSVDPGETAMFAAVRELAEETGLALFGDEPFLTLETFHVLAPRYVPDPRASDEAWAVTVPAYVDLGTRDTLPAVTGGDDARCAEWVRAGTYEDLVATLAGVYGGQVFAAHADMLRRFLGPDQAALAALITDAAAQDCTYCGARPGVPCVTGPDGWHLARFLGVLPGRAEARLVGAAATPHGDMSGIVRLPASPEVTP